jgi:hypothetical protein
LPSANSRVRLSLKLTIISLKYNGNYVLRQG